MRFLFILSTFLLISCTGNNQAQQQTDPRLIQQEQEKLIPYADFLAEMKSSNAYKENPSDRFFEFIQEDVPKYWIGTGWDFNGTTRTPRKGKIACGYFVTNLLVDFGLNIRRIYLAQQPSSTLIEKVCAQKSIKNYSSLDQLLKHIRNSQYENEVFIVGLDYHTGFITKQGKNIYFIHSTYLPPNGVVKEVAENSLALQSSNFFMIGSISQNKKWF